MPTALTVIAVIADQPGATVNQPPQTDAAHAYCLRGDVREPDEGVGVLGVEQRRL